VLVQGIPQSGPTGQAHMLKQDCFVPKNNGSHGPHFTPAGDYDTLAQGGLGDH